MWKSQLVCRAPKRALTNLFKLKLNFKAVPQHNIHFVVKKVEKLQSHPSYRYFLYQSIQMIAIVGTLFYILSNVGCLKLKNQTTGAITQRWISAPSRMCRIEI